MQNFSSLALKLRKEFEVTGGGQKAQSWSNPAPVLEA